MNQDYKRLQDRVIYLDARLAAKDDEIIALKQILKQIEDLINDKKRNG